jgi:carboxyl-terminal processing protease
MTRERVAWLLAAVLMAALAFQLNGTLAHRDDDYAFVRTLLNVHRQIARNYVDPVDEEKLRLAAIKGLLSPLDPYCEYIPPVNQENYDRRIQGRLKGIGVTLGQTENGDIKVISPIEGSPAFHAGVLAGDIILGINGEPTRNLKIDEVQQKILNGPVVVRLKVRHETGGDAELTMAREEIQLPTIKGYRRRIDKPDDWDWYVRPEQKLAYIRITEFTPNTMPRIEDVLRTLVADGVKGIILDLRFNGGGLLEAAEKLVDLFVEDGIIVSTRGRGRGQTVIKAKKEGTLPANISLAILVNHDSASASEVVAGSLQDHHRAIIVGQRTYGKGSVQEVIPLDDREGELKLTVAYYYLPSGRLVHKKPGATDADEWGVQPQIRIEMNAEQQKDLYLAMRDAEIIGHPNAASQPATQAATMPATRATSVPATQASVDPQLDAAVTALLTNVQATGPAPAAPTTTPASHPATRSKDGQP